MLVRKRGTWVNAGQRHAPTHPLPRKLSLTLTVAFLETRNVSLFHTIKPATAPNLHSLSILRYCAMAERRSPQALPEPHPKPNDSDREPHDANQTQRLTESPSAAESQRVELRSSDERRTESNLETLGGAVASSVQTLAVQHHRSDGNYFVQCVAFFSTHAYSKWIFIFQWIVWLMWQICKGALLRRIPVAKPKVRLDSIYLREFI